CYAWRLGVQGEPWRANDDGEPSGSAGRSILGQLLSQRLTYVLVVVVRYFGGTKLGVPGLIQAYREAAADAIAAGRVEERTEDAHYEITFPYLAMNDVMKAVKEYAPTLSGQHFDNLCRITLLIRRNTEESFVGKLSKIEGVNVEFLYYR
ncbi:MAG: YigZ family protein, partial [Rikenellaceae bacterium]|nr:YigZ family protein [Rikenellaceae bacterium]